MQGIPVNILPINFTQRLAGTFLREIGLAEEVNFDNAGSGPINHEMPTVRETVDSSAASTLFELESIALKPELRLPHVKLRGAVSDNVFGTYL